MKIIVAYDISDNIKREAFAGFLKRMGLERIQRSLFIGRGGSSLVKDIERMARRIIDADHDCVHIFMLSAYDQTRIRIIGTPYNEAVEHGIQAIAIY